MSSNRIDRLAKGVYKLQNENAALGQVTNEIIALENSSQMYNVIASDKLSDSKVDKTGAIYNKATNAVDIVLPKNGKLGLFAHEALNTYQFETGIASLTTHDGNLNVQPISNWLAYDQSDEKAAYLRQGLFGSTQHNLPDEYSNRPFGPVNIYSIPTIGGVLNQSPKLQDATFHGVSNRTGQAFRINGNTYAPK